MQQTRIQTTPAIRRSNRQNILRLIFHAGAISRTGLANQTGLTGTGISRIIRELLDSGLIEEGSVIPRNGIPGRRETELLISGSVARVIAVSLNADDKTIVLVNIRGEILDDCSIGIPLANNQEMVINHIGKLILKMIKRNRLQESQVLGIALAMPGKVDPKLGVLIESGIYGWRLVSVSETLQRLTGLPVSIENLNNAINRSETQFGLTQGIRNVLLIRVGTGQVGASLIADGNLVRGRSSGTGQIAHLSINSGKRSCECGRIGCLNTCASGFAILAHYERKNFVPVKPKDQQLSNQKIQNVLERAEQGEKQARAVLLKAGASMGTTLVQIAETLYPDTILIAGKVGRSTFYMRGLVDAWDKLANEETRHAIDLRISTRSALTAAIELAIDSFVLSIRLDIRPLRQVLALQDAA